MRRGDWCWRPGGVAAHRREERCRMVKILEKLETGREEISMRLEEGRARVRGLGVRVKDLKVKVKMRVKVVGSRLRVEGPLWARRGAVALLVGLLYHQGWQFRAILHLLLALATTTFLLLPVIFKFTPFIQRNLVFLPFIRKVSKDRFSLDLFLN